MSSPSNLGESTFGAFRVGDMALALPMNVMREVVPLTPLHQLPHPAAWMLGGLDLRGVLVPVLDLSLLCGKPPTVGEDCCVVVLACDNRLLGLLATAVDCLFTAQPEQMSPFHSTEPIGRVATGSLFNPLSRQLLTLLCAESLINLPQVASVSDREPQRQHPVLNLEHAIARETGNMPLLLMRSAGLLFAVDPSHIETTMPRAQLLESDISDGYYRGNTVYRDCEIPAICLSEYLYMEDARHRFLPKGSQVQPAFVLRCEEGLLAVLIDEIVDIVHINPKQMISLPPVPALKPDVLQQTIPKQSVYPDSEEDEQYYVINPAGLVADTRLRELARLMHQTMAQKQSGTVTEAAQARQGSTGGPRMIVFEMHGDHATPIEQVSEVLQYRGIREAFAAHNPFRGILTHRGRAIPVIDLAQHMGLARQQLDARSNVLVVKLEESDQLVGLAVGCLRSIEQARWSPTTPVLGAQRTARHGPERTSQQLVEVRVLGEPRLLEVVQARQEALCFFRESLAGATAVVQAAQPAAA